MGGNQLVAIITASIVITIMLAVWVGIEEALLAVVTFLIVFCLCLMMVMDSRGTSRRNDNEKGDKL